MDESDFEDSLMWRAKTGFNYYFKDLIGEEYGYGFSSGIIFDGKDKLLAIVLNPLGWGFDKKTKKDIEEKIGEKYHFEIGKISRIYDVVIDFQSKKKSN